MSELREEMPAEFVERPGEVVLVRQRVLHRYFKQKAAALKAAQVPTRLLDDLVTALRVADNPEFGVTALTDPVAAKEEAQRMLTRATEIARINLKYPGAKNFEARRAACADGDMELLNEEEPEEATCVPKWVAANADRWTEDAPDAVADYWRELVAYLDKKDKKEKGRFASYLSPGSKRQTMASKMISEARAVPSVLKSPKKGRRT
jgi:hypothetical protein